MRNEGRLPWTSFEEVHKGTSQNCHELFVGANDGMTECWYYQSDVLRNEKPKRPTKRNLHDGIVCCDTERLFVPSFPDNTQAHC